MGLEIKIDPGRSLNSSAPILNNSPAVSGDVHPGTEWVIPGVGGNTAVLGQEEPWEQDKTDWDHPGTKNGIDREKTGLRFSRYGSAGCLSRVGMAGSSTRTDITIPEIQFKVFPVAPFP